MVAEILELKIGTHSLLTVGIIQQIDILETLKPLRHILDILEFSFLIFPVCNALRKFCQEFFCDCTIY